MITNNFNVIAKAVGDFIECCGLIGTDELKESVGVFALVSRSYQSRLSAVTLITLVVEPNARFTEEAVRYQL